MYNIRKLDDRIFLYYSKFNLQIASKSQIVIFLDTQKWIKNKYVLESPLQKEKKKANN